MHATPFLRKLISESEPHPATGSDNFMDKLSKKIQAQARDLSFLQNELVAAKEYSSLCEKRVLDLCPGHQLPVTKSSIGSRPQPAAFDVILSPFHPLRPINAICCNFSIFSCSILFRPLSSPGCRVIWRNVKGSYALQKTRYV